MKGSRVRAKGHKRDATAAGVGGAIVTVLVFGAGIAGVDVPPGVAASLVTLATAILGLFSYGKG
jgi:hypothetical protein